MADRTQPPNDISPTRVSPSTLAVWAGESEYLVQGATQVPVIYSAAYGYPDVDTWLEAAAHRKPGHIYSRNSNPTVQAFEEKIRSLEGAQAATSFASGMAAISNTLFTLLSPGDRVVSIKDTYGGTSKIFLEFLPRLQIDVDLCETSDHEQIETAVAHGCRILYLESPTNPTLKVMDIARLARAGHDAGALVVVLDNTFATPVNQNPLSLGADVVVHSATKFLGGHADAMGGALCGDTSLVDRVSHTNLVAGPDSGGQSGSIPSRFGPRHCGHPANGKAPTPAQSLQAAPDTDPVSLEAWNMMQKAGVTIVQGDPEFDELDQSGPYAFLRSIDAAIQKKQARLLTQQKPPEARIPGLTGGSAGASAAALTAQLQELQRDPTRNMQKSREVSAQLQKALRTS